MRNIFKRLKNVPLKPTAKTNRHNCQDNDHFHFLNLNPAGRHTGDCVFRAVAYFLNWSWHTVFWDMSAHCSETGLVQNWTTGYNSYLKRLGLERKIAPRRENRKLYTIGEWAEEFAKPGKKYLVTSSNHMTCISDKKIVDAWDCSKRVMNYYWELPEQVAEPKPLYHDLIVKIR